MAKKTNRNLSDNPEEKASFELGVKGDEFERKYRRAAMSSSVPADRLLNSLSRESSADKYNFLGFAIPALIIVITALSLTVISRGDIEERLNVQPSLKTVVNGEYFKNLNEVYEQTVPFKDAAARLCASLGLCEAPAEPDKPVPDEEPVPPSPDFSAEQVVTKTAEPVATAAPSETEPPVTVQTEETEPESYETYTMYAGATLNIRFGPSTDDAILGYFIQNDPIDVITIREDGWAEILYNGMKAYAYSEYMSDSEVKTTTTRRRSRSDASTTVNEPEETTFSGDENGGATTVPDGGSGEPASAYDNDGGEHDPHGETASSDNEQSDGSEIPSDGGGQPTDENGEPW